MARCVNLDWLEVSCDEDYSLYPCNADFFREQGFFVHERDYGTRVWGEVFTIEDQDGHDWIEIRRAPPSGNSEFKGLTEYSCRLRVVNAQLYVKDCTQRLLAFLVRFNYTFKRIFRIDIAYDFEKFDYGDQPARFARRYIERKFRKINQCKLRVIGDDNWTDFDWESLSWGSQTSMVSTKMYNKSKELKTVSKQKTWIPMSWFECGLIDDPINRTKRREDGTIYEPEIWRIEFSMKSKADRWLVIENQGGKHVKKTAIPHTPDMFDSPDKLWQRFQDLAFHYFRFKIAEYNDERDKDGNLVPKRKDLCADKRLFRFDADREFHQLDMCVSGGKPDADDEILLRRLRNYRNKSADTKVRTACDVLIEALETSDLRRYTSKQVWAETQALQELLRRRMKMTEKDAIETLEQVKQDFLDYDGF